MPRPLRKANRDLASHLIQQFDGHHAPRCSNFRIEALLNVGARCSRNRPHFTDRFHEQFERVPRAVEDSQCVLAVDTRQERTCNVEPLQGETDALPDLRLQYRESCGRERYAIIREMTAPT